MKAIKINHNAGTLKYILNIDDKIDNKFKKAFMDIIDELISSDEKVTPSIFAKKYIDRIKDNIKLNEAALLYLGSKLSIAFSAPINFDHSELTVFDSLVNLKQDREKLQMLTDHLNHYFEKIKDTRISYAYEEFIRVKDIFLDNNISDTEYKASIMFIGKLISDAAS